MFFSQPLHFVTHTLSITSHALHAFTSLNGPYYLVLGIHFTSRVVSTMVRRRHNKGVSKVRTTQKDNGEHNNTITGQKRMIGIKLLLPLLWVTMSGMWCLLVLRMPLVNSKTSWMIFSILSAISPLFILMTFLFIPALLMNIGNICIRF